MRRYLMIFRIRFINNMQYRAAMFAGIATQFVWAIMGILVYKAFAETEPQSLPMELSQLASYMWMQQAFLPFFAMWFLDNKLINAISSGEVAYEFVRPFDLYNFWFTQSVANRVSHGILRSVPVLLVAFFLPTPYKLIWIKNGTLLILFLISMILSVIVVVAFSMLIYTTTFYTISPYGTKIIIAAFSDFLAGSTIPLTFFPGYIRRVAELLPFASMLNMPLRIFVGDFTYQEACQGIALQLFWAIVLLSVGRIVMGKAFHKVIVQGG